MSAIRHGREQLPADIAAQQRQLVRDRLRAASRPGTTRSNLRHPAPVSADRFTWFARGRQFVTEISDLGPHPFGPVFYDACDEGLTLVSRYPGREDIVFVVSHTEVRDGDLRYWDLVAARPQRDPGFTLRIFND